jgi:UDP-2,3-diacylglucosamine hydrolase
VAVALIADAHLGGPGGPPEPLLHQLDQLAAGGCERLVFMGDLFHVWVGDRRYESPEVTRLLPELHALRERGLRVDYVEGNRDFFLDDSSYADAFESVGREIAFVVDGARYLAVHGDGLNRRDWRYLFWRRLSKNRVSRHMSRRLPARLGRRLVHATDRRLERTNFRHRIAVPEGAVLRYAERRLAEGHDVLLLGHFHDPRCWRIEAGEVRILEAWFYRHRIELIGGEG